MALYGKHDNVGSYEFWSAVLQHSTRKPSNELAMFRFLRFFAKILVFLGLGLAFANQPAGWVLGCLAAGAVGVVAAALGEDVTAYQRLAAAVEAHARRHGLPYDAAQALARFVRPKALVALAFVAALGMAGFSFLMAESPTLVVTAWSVLMMGAFAGGAVWAARRFAGEKATWEALAACLGLTYAFDPTTYAPTMAGAFRGREVFAGVQRRRWRRGYRCFGTRDINTTCITVAAALPSSLPSPLMRRRKRLPPWLAAALEARPGLLTRLNAALPYLWLMSDDMTLKLQWAGGVLDCATLHFLLTLACDLADFLESRH